MPVDARFDARDHPLMEDALGVWVEKRYRLVVAESEAVPGVVDKGVAVPSSPKGGPRCRIHVLPCRTWTRRAHGLSVGFTDGVERLLDLGGDRPTARIRVRSA